MSDNPEALIIRHLGIVISRPKVLLFTRKKLSPMKQADLRDMFKKASMSIYTSAVVVSPDPLVSYSINFFSHKDSIKHKKEDPDDPEPADGVEYSSD
jgi:hypothetical protein